MHESDLMVTLNMDSPVFQSVLGAFRDYSAQSCEIWMVSVAAKQTAASKDCNYQFAPVVRNEGNRNYDTAY